ncbi:MAG: hypothetical protein K2L66_03780, partial [Paramuribaculum sp.]|nr:hypothetical protein [Paramuribaculum sp.]
MTKTDSWLSLSLCLTPIPHGGSSTGFDTSLQHATESRDITASKRIMVTPNAPRFLRNGDEADIEVAVFNNSDNAVKATVINEWFDPADGHVIGRHE